MRTDERIDDGCAAQVCAVLDKQGFVTIPGVLTDQEAARGLSIVTAAITDPAREPGTFASQTDIRYGRRDFVPLPSTPEVLSFAALLCKRLDRVLLEYCGRTRSILELSTLTSHRGSSHQYLHRDPSGVLCMFVAVDDVSPEQGGTVFAPGTHLFNGGEARHDGKANMLMPLFQAQTNIKVLRHNLSKLRQMRKRADARMSSQEYWDRLFSRHRDNHQPNLMRFMLGKNAVFDVTNVSPRNLLAMHRHRRTLESSFRLVQTAPKKGTATLYRSDILHAGPDNRSERPRCLFGMSIARDIIGDRLRDAGYSPHSTLRQNPKTLGDLLNLAGV